MTADPAAETLAPRTRVACPSPARATSRSSRGLRDAARRAARARGRATRRRETGLLSRRPTPASARAGATPGDGRRALAERGYRRQASLGSDGRRRRRAGRVLTFDSAPKPAALGPAPEQRPRRAPSHRPGRSAAGRHLEDALGRERAPKRVARRRVTVLSVKGCMENSCHDLPKYKGSPLNRGEERHQLVLDKIEYCPVLDSAEC